MKTTRTKTIHKRINTGHLIVHLALLAGIVVVVFPFLWMLLTSFKTTGESLKIPPTFFPEKWLWKLIRQSRLLRFPSAPFT